MPLQRSRKSVLPSAVGARMTLFDRLAQRASAAASRPLFFAGCVILIVGWLPTLILLNVNSSQLILNTMTQIVTFLLVALLQNSETRADKATQHKLNAVAAGVAALLREQTSRSSSARDDLEELQLAIGLENRESTS